LSDEIRIELNGAWSEWSGMRQLVASLSPELRTRIVVDSFWSDAVQTGDIYYLWDAVRESTLPKALVAEQQHFNIAEALGAEFIPAPKPNAWLSIDRLQMQIAAAVSAGPYVLLCGIGMSTECLIWRLWDGQSIMVDCGHVFDAMNGMHPRRYLRGTGRTHYRRFQEWLARSRAEESASLTSR